MAALQEMRMGFFQTPIVVFAAPADRDSIQAQFRELQHQIPDAQVEFVDVSVSEDTPVIYHRGDVLFGRRVQQFFAYARSLAGA